MFNIFYLNLFYVTFVFSLSPFLYLLVYTRVCLCVFVSSYSYLKDILKGKDRPLKSISRHWCRNGYMNFRRLSSAHLQDSIIVLCYLAVHTLLNNTYSIRSHWKISSKMLASITDDLTLLNKFLSLIPTSRS